MAKFSIVIETSTAQDESLAWLLAGTNADAVHRDKPLPDVSALLTELLHTMIENCVPHCQQERKAQIATALDTASPEQWAKIADMLGLKLPGGEAVAAISVMP